MNKRYNLSVNVKMDAMYVIDMKKRAVSIGVQPLDPYIHPADAGRELTTINAINRATLNAGEYLFRRHTNILSEIRHNITTLLTVPMLNMFIRANYRTYFGISDHMAATTAGEGFMNIQMKFMKEPWTSFAHTPTYRLYKELYGDMSFAVFAEDYISHRGYKGRMHDPVTPDQAMPYLYRTAAKMRHLFAGYTNYICPSGILSAWSPCGVIDIPPNKPATLLAGDYSSRGRTISGYRGKANQARVVQYGMVQGFFYGPQCDVNTRVFAYVVQVGINAPSVILWEELEYLPAKAALIVALMGGSEEEISTARYETKMRLDDWGSKDPEGKRNMKEQFLNTFNDAIGVGAFIETVEEVTDEEVILQNVYLEIVKKKIDEILHRQNGHDMKELLDDLGIAHKYAERKDAYQQIQTLNKELQDAEDAEDIRVVQNQLERSKRDTFYICESEDDNDPVVLADDWDAKSAAVARCILEKEIEADEPEKERIPKDKFDGQENCYSTIRNVFKNYVKILPFRGGSPVMDVLTCTAMERKVRRALWGQNVIKKSVVAKIGQKENDRYPSLEEAQETLYSYSGMVGISVVDTTTASFHA